MTAGCVNNRLYHLVAINERSGQAFQVTAVPLQHSKACTLMGKFTVHAARRLELKEAQGKCDFDSGGSPKAGRL